MSRTSHRREFLQSASLTAAGLVAAGFSGTSSGYGASETLNIGCIGTGGRCRMLMNSLSKIAGVRIAAVCDVWDVHLEQAKKLADPAAQVSKDFRAVLDRPDIDAVLIAAPDHWHVPMLVAACQAGKDVYVEKPLTHDLSEGAAAIEAQNKHQRIVQVGMQQRSMPHIQQARELVRSGQLGDIHKVHLTWNRNTPRHTTNKLGIDPASVNWQAFLGSAPSQPFDEYRFRNWRWFWDFGGGILTDLMVHWIDVANWLLELDHPQMAVSVGDHFATKGLWETPDSMQTLLRYPDKQVQAYFEGTFVNARNASMIEFMGTEGTLYIDRGRYEVIPERRSKLERQEQNIGGGERGQDFYVQPDGELLHLTNWVECIRSRSRPTAPAEAGVSAVTGAHLGNQAYRDQTVAVWQ
jgi:predicted dehydrogenase